MCSQLMSERRPATRELGDERAHLRGDRRRLPSDLLAVDEVDDLAGAPGDLEAMRLPQRDAAELGLASLARRCWFGHGASSRCSWC